MSRRSAIEFVFVPHKSDTECRRYTVESSPPPLFALLALPFSTPATEAEQLPTHCCDTQDLLAVTARCYFFIWTKDLPAVRYYSSSRLSRSSLRSLTPRGWKLKREMFDATRNAEWSPGAYMFERPVIGCSTFRGWKLKCNAQNGLIFDLRNILGL